MVAQLDRLYVSAVRSRTLNRLVTYGAFEGRPITTRGQAVNPIVRQQLQLAARHWPRTEVDRPIFITGLGRSGTTILGKILGTHPCVGFLNEPKILWNIIHPQEDVIGAYTLDGRYFFSGADATPAVRTRARRLYNWYGFATRSSRIVDKNPELVYRVPFVRSLFWDAKIIGIARRPGPAVASITKWSEVHGRTNENWWGVRDQKWRLILSEVVPRHHDLMEMLTGSTEGPSIEDRGIIEWVIAMRALLSAQAAGGVNVVVRYEDLTAAPAEVLRSVLDGVELQVEGRVLKYAQEVVRKDQSGSTNRADFGKWTSIVQEVSRDLGYEAAS